MDILTIHNLPVGTYLVGSNLTASRNSGTDSVITFTYSINPDSGTILSGKIYGIDASVNGSFRTCSPTGVIKVTGSSITLSVNVPTTARIDWWHSLWAIRIA